MKKSELILFAEATLNSTYDVEVITPVDEKAALASVLQEIEGLLTLNNFKTRKNRHNHFKIPGTDEDSYCERQYELDRRGSFFAGIRHAGGNPQLPFVNVTLGFEMGPGDVPEIASIVAEEFKQFQPLNFAAWMKPKAESNFPRGSLKVARRYLARRVSELELPFDNSVPFEVRRIENDSYFRWYEDEYRKFHDANPDLKSWVTISDKDELENYRNERLLFGSYLDGRLIGLVGGESRSLLGLSGLYMGELLISEEYKGEGFAPQMQKQFLRHAGEGFEVVWGTIDARNIPSTRTALRVGRRPMREEIFFPLQ